MQTEQLLCWSGMTDTEHSKTSSSNEEEVQTKILLFFTFGHLTDLPKLFWVVFSFLILS